MAIRRQIGLRDFHVCPLTSDIVGQDPVYESPVRIPGIISATMSVERTNDSYYSDDTVEESFSSFNQITLEVEVSNLSIAERKLLLGVQGANGGVFSNKDDASQEVGIMFRSRKTNGKFRYISLMKGKFVEPDENYGTEADSITAQTMTMTFTGIPLQSNGNYRLVVDEDEADVNADYIRDFFNEMRFEEPPVQ